MLATCPSLDASLRPSFLNPTAAAAIDHQQLSSVHSNGLHSGASQATAAVSAAFDKSRRGRRRPLLQPLVAPDCPLPAASNASHGVSTFPQADVMVHNTGSKNGHQPSQKAPVRKSLFAHDGRSDADAHDRATKAESLKPQQAGLDGPAIAGCHADQMHESRKCIEPVKPEPADVPDFSSVFDFL